MKQHWVRFGFCLVLCAGPIRAASPAPESTGYRQPGEFEPQAAVWLSAAPDDAEFTNVTAEMANALLPQVRVRMLVADEAALAMIKPALQQRGVPLDRIEFLVDPLATYFIRDGTVYLVNDRGGLAVLDLKWSDYGLPGWGKLLHPDDPVQQEKYASWVNTAMDAIDLVMAKASNATVVPSPLYLENATFEVNGRGVLLISEPLALERNPTLARDEIERELRLIPGIRKVIWLGHGLADDPLEISTITGDYVGMGAGGHTDEFVKFTDPHTILLAWPESTGSDEHPVERINRERMEVNYKLLTQATDQDGKPFRVLKVPMPAVIERKLVLVPKEDKTSMWKATAFPASEGRKTGDELRQVAAATYLNFVIANNVVLVPSFVEDGTAPATQERVRKILEAALPGRTIKFIHATPLMWHGGGLHCATLSEPDPGTAPPHESK